jgi:hypothetical protein
VLAKRAPSRLRPGRRVARSGRPSSLPPQPGSCGSRPAPAGAAGRIKQVRGQGAASPLSQALPSINRTSSRPSCGQGGLAALRRSPLACTRRSLPRCSLRSQARGVPLLRAAGSAARNRRNGTPRPLLSLPPGRSPLRLAQLQPGAKLSGSGEQNRGRQGMGTLSGGGHFGIKPPQNRAAPDQPATTTIPLRIPSLRESTPQAQTPLCTRSRTSIFPLAHHNPLWYT